jgi:hypothetical protein
MDGSDRGAIRTAGRVTTAKMTKGLHRAFRAVARGRNAGCIPRYHWGLSDGSSHDGIPLAETRRVHKGLKARMTKGSRVPIP